MPRKGAALDRSEVRWMLLIHQIPPTPAYLRVKVGRQLREVVEGLLSGMEARMRTVEGREPAKASLAIAQHRGRTLRAIAEIVHAIDVKDAKYGREEAPGIGQLVAGIAAAHADDEERLVRGTAVFDDLHALYSGVTKH